MVVVITGLLAGLIHVLSGPDHLTAIAPLAVHRPRAAWIPGVRWGLGHSTGVAVVGLLALWLRDKLPLDLVSSWGDRMVGVVLFGIGLWALHRARKHKIHAHEHVHHGQRHIHFHVHQRAAGHDDPQAHDRHTHAAFPIGMLHGLAGSSHVLGILPMLALPTQTEAITYLVAFGGGTILAMAGFSSGLGWLTSRYAANSVKLYRELMSTCAVAAMVIGCIWFAGKSW